MRITSAGAASGFVISDGTTTPGVRLTGNAGIEPAGFGVETSTPDRSQNVRMSASTPSSATKPGTSTPVRVGQPKDGHATYQLTTASTGSSRTVAESRSATDRTSMP